MPGHLPLNVQAARLVELVRQKAVPRWFRRVLPVPYLCLMQLLSRVWPQQWHLRATLVLALSGASLAPALAQQAGEDLATIRLQPEDAQRGLNGHQHNFYFLPPGASGENYVNAGFFGQGLRPYLAGNEDALGQLDLYKSRKTQYLVDRIVAVGAFALYGQQILAHDHREYANPTQLVAGSVFVGSLIATIFITRNTNSYMQRAVGAFNGTSRRGHGAVWPRLRPAGLDVGQARGGQPLLGLHWALR